MSLRIYNTLTRCLEDFSPIEAGKVRVYICGLTVYDDMHIGHARTYLAFDSILRYLRYLGYDVRYVQNVTDVDDKIIKRAKQRNTDPSSLSLEFSKRALQDQEILGLVKADVYPKVTENIEGIILATKALVDNGAAYVTEQGVYFDVSRSSDYGKLSHQDTEQLSNHRIEPDPQKRTPLDFSLWKKVKENELGFDSPWGKGRPGWHIECTVMSQRYLGDQIDIHGGALDLIFPHHENEVAQSEALTGKKPFVRYWLHTGFLNSSGEKMSKSLGNIVAVREFVKTQSPQAFRLFILQTHYRSPIDYSTENVSNAARAVERLIAFRTSLNTTATTAKGTEQEAASVSGKLISSFNAAMDDDFNTPRAVSAIFEAVRDLNGIIARGNDSKESLLGSLRAFDEVTNVLGLALNKESIELTSDEKALVTERNNHRAQKNWAEADRIRKLLLEQGLSLRDKSDGTTVVERVSL